jgi:hypothetical protein
MPIVGVVIMVSFVIMVCISGVAVEFLQPPGPFSHEFIEPCIEGSIFSLSVVFKFVGNFLSGFFSICAVL